jgi:hypothetical protein
MGCEVVLDIVNYEKIPPEPDKKLRDQRGEVAYQQALREHDNAKRINETRKAFFLAVRWFLIKQTHLVEIKADFAGNPANEQEGLKLDDAIAGLTDSERARFLAVAGLLLADSQLDPLNGKQPEMLDEAAGDETKEAKVAAPFKNALTRALAEYNTYPDLFDRVHGELRERSKAGADSKFYARQLAAIGRRLVAEKVRPGDSQFGVRFSRALSESLSGATEGRQSSIDIDLPDLEAGTEADIIGDNVTALSAIYFAAMLEELKLFAVMDKVVEQFMNGALPIKRSSAGDPLYRYHRDAQTRINEFERRGLYARSFGVAQGSVDEAMPNREFNDLWFRFLSAVSLYGRELKSTERRMVSKEQVFKSARDLAVNLSLHGYGMAHFAAVELQSLIKSIKDTLSFPDVLAAYGVRDVWQLVERVSNMYLGGAVNGVRQRTMAQSGAKVVQWLADSSPVLIGPIRDLLIDDTLISHVERWLSVTGTPDQAVEKYSEPVSLQSQRTIPDFALPSGAASDALRDAMSRVNLPITPQN